MATKPQAPPAPFTIDTCPVWQATLSVPVTGGMSAGMLLTEPGDLNAPIAFLVDDDAIRGTAVDMVERAREYLANPWKLDAPGAPCVDLRDRGRPWSRREIPGWMYGLRVMPVGVDSPAREVEWSPFCPVRLARLNLMASDMRRRERRGPRPTGKRGGRHGGR